MTQHWIAALIPVPLLLAPSGPTSTQAETAVAMGLMVGEVTGTTAVVQVRLTASAELVDGDAFEDGDALRDGDLPGRAGSVRFRYSADGEGDQQWTQPVEANAGNDFMARAVLKGLTPGSRYRVGAVITGDDPMPTDERDCTFRTLPGSSAKEAVRFHVVTGLNYDKFYGPKGYGEEDRGDGYPACSAMAALRPDFVVYTGDSVYYDKVPKTKTLRDMRAKWHRQLSRPRMVELQRVAPGYWMKDDHDHRTNDSDAEGDGFPSHELGIETFREQVPIFAQEDSASPTYRTHRVTQDVQIWLLEGRDYRSPNKMEDGPEKTLWGEEQRQWLQRTLLASDAAYRLIISPTPLVGPDDAYKRDNHTNPRGFQREGLEFKDWAAKNELWEDGTFLLCGDRHWQYHTVDPSGAQEFSSGAICDANSRLGRRPGDPKSTDPEGLIRQPYTQKRPSGGFLQVECAPGQGDQPATIRFQFFDESGALLYSFSPR